MRRTVLWVALVTLPLGSACSAANNQTDGGPGAGETGAADSGSGDETIPGDSVGESAPDAVDDAGESGAEAAVDPCGGLTSGGKCLSASKVTWCQTETDNGGLKIIEKSCGATEECKVTGGVADCISKPGLCEPGAKECDSTKTKLRTCDAAGAWKEDACPTACAPSTIGAFCEAVDPTGGSLPTKTFTGTVKYEYQGPNDPTKPTDWSPTIKTAPGVRVLVVSYRGTEQIDATETDDNGDFSLKIPTTTAAGDIVTAWAVRAKPGGLDAGVAFGVGIPKVADGTVAINGVPEDGNQFWGWSWGLDTTSSGSTLTIKEDKGSGAMRVFDYLRYAYDATTFLYKASGKSLIVWVRYNTGWSCGACEWDVPGKVDSFSFDSQIFMPAIAEDTEYWADSVTAHELGHWVMSSYGRSPQEGGKHCVGVPTLPGQAWSEGWATFFSSMTRDDELYYDKQGGGFFWVNIGTAKRSGSSGEKALVTPIVADGLLQEMDENLVSSYAWNLTKPVSTGSTKLGDNKHFLDALASDRMKIAPYGRGYTRHKWQMTGCTKSSVTDLGSDAPMFADYLDALLCLPGGKVTAAEVDAVTNPTTTYPFPADKPVCK